MSGIKIINVLKDDTLSEIMDLFRQASAGEVIFVLPKNSKVFRSEDQFAAFAAEAAGAGKTVSILAPDPKMGPLARKYGFNMMTSGQRGRPKAKAKLATMPPPADDDIQDTSEDAFQGDVSMTSDETMGIRSQDDGTEERALEGFHVEDGTGPVDTDTDDNDLPDRPTTKDLAYDAELTSTDNGSADYIDAVWRAKQGKGPALAATRNIKRPWHHVISRTAANFSRRAAVALLTVSAVVLGAAVYVTAGKAVVTVVPVAKPVDLKISVQASDRFAAVDAAFARIPGQQLKLEKSATAEQLSSGRREVASKARGHIILSNGYSSIPQTLVATTRLESPEGLVFHTLQSVTIPGSTVQAGKPIEGATSVEVIADKPGAIYNVPAGKFTIMAFKERGDKERAERIYGTSETPMTGGASGPSSVVTEDDFNRANAAAAEQAKGFFADALSALGGGLHIIDSLEPAWTTPQANARVDDAAEKISVTIAGTLETIAFRQDDLEELIAQTALKNERLVVLPSQLELAYGDAAYDRSTSILTFTLTAKGIGYLPVDAQAVRTDIKGKGMAEIRRYFESAEGVDSASVRLSPFWVRSVPKSDPKVTVDRRYGEPEPVK